MCKKLVNAFHVLISVVVIVQLMGCGTIMYPERKGQKAGRIDTGVALLDGLGLLLFLVPGIIAFAVDFSNGTIYLPGTAMGPQELKNMKQVKFDPKQNSIASIEETIHRETGVDVKLYRDDMRIVKLGSVDEMLVQFAQITPGIQDSRSIALSR